MHTHTHTRTHKRQDIHTCTCIHTYIMHACIQTCIRTYANKDIRIYIHTAEG
jgi:hypothetical protein